MIFDNPFAKYLFSKEFLEDMTIFLAIYQS